MLKRVYLVNACQVQSQLVQSDQFSYSLISFDLFVLYLSFCSFDPFLLSADSVYRLGTYLKDHQSVMNLSFVFLVARSTHSPLRHIASPLAAVLYNHDSCKHFVKKKEVMAVASAAAAAALQQSRRAWVCCQLVRRPAMPQHDHACRQEPVGRGRRVRRWLHASPAARTRSAPCGAQAMRHAR